MRRVTRRFAEVVCPPGMRAHHRTDRVMAEFELMLAALGPTARKALTAAIVVLDHGARMYPRAGGGGSPGWTTKPPRPTSGRCWPAAGSRRSWFSGCAAWS